MQRMRFLDRALSSGVALVVILVSRVPVTEATEHYNFDYVHHGQDWRSAHCSSRERQSPIDIKADVMLLDPEPNKTVYFSYEDVTGEFPFQNNGHSLSADFAGYGYGGISYGMSWYNLINVNFHAKSEHTFAGRHYAMEMHLVHKQYDGTSIIVVAVPIDSERKPDIDLVYGAGKKTPASYGFKGDEMTRVVADYPNLLQRKKGHTFLQRKKSQSRKGPWFPATAPAYTPPSPTEANHNAILQAFLKQRSPKLLEIQQASASENEPLNFNGMLEGGTYVEYAGSFTAPPCTEAVTWFVRREPIMAGNEQVRFLYESLYQMTNDWGNYRSVMPLMGRILTIRGSENRIPVLTDAKDDSMADVPSERAFNGLTNGVAAYKEAVRNAMGAAELDNRIRASSLAHANELADPVGSGPPFNMSQLIPVFPTPAGYAEPPCETVACKLSKMGDDMIDKINTTAHKLLGKAAYTIGDSMRSSTQDAVHDFLMSQTPPPTPTFPPGSFGAMPTRSPPVEADAPEGEPAADATPLSASVNFDTGVIAAAAPAPVN